jgi:hypothetical protein
MGVMAAVLGRRAQRPTSDLVLKFLEHFALISDALESADLWDEDDGFFYDRLRLPDGTRVPLRVRSIVGILPLLAAIVVDEHVVDRARSVDKRAAALLDFDVRSAEGLVRGEPGERRLLLGAVSTDRLLRVFERLFDESEFLSPHGLRAVSREHLEHPFELRAGDVGAQVDYEPAESTTGMFGGNSNWRGPVWFPVNYLVVSSLKRYARFFGDDVTIEYPTGSGERLTLAEVADDLGRRLVSLFLVGDDGRRPCFGWVDRLQRDPAWKDNILFNEYFHGDNGAGLGASHQTGWTGLVADLIIRRSAPTLVELLEAIERTEAYA